MDLSSFVLQLVLLEESVNLRKPRSEYSNTLTIDSVGVEYTVVDVVKNYDYKFFGYIVTNLSGDDQIDVLLYINDQIVYRDSYRAGENFIYVKPIAVPKGSRTRLTVKLVSGSTPKYVVYRIIVKAI